MNPLLLLEGHNAAGTPRHEEQPHREVSIWLDTQPPDVRVQWWLFGPGYEDEVRKVMPNEDQTVRVELRPLEP